MKNVDELKERLQKLLDQREEFHEEVKEDLQYLLDHRREEIRADLKEDIHYLIEHRGELRAELKEDLQTLRERRGDLAVDLKSKIVDLIPDQVTERLEERLEEHRQKQIFSGVDELPKGLTDEHLIHGCICCEGGAFRGLYGEGVLDALMEAGINFDACIGVSAGALNGMNYVSGQIGRSARTNLTYRHNSKFVGLEALKESHSPLNLDFLLEDMNEVDPLNEERFFRPQQRFVAVATNCLNGQTMYYEKGICQDIFSAIKASASMPFISPMVDVEGTPCLDGGCSCKIPYQWALDQNYEKIVVIKTRERGYRKEDKASESASRIYRKHQLFAEVLDQSNIMYNQQCDELDRLEQEGRIFVIAPSEPVTVGRIEGDMEKLGTLYYLGYQDAKAQLPELLDYLEK